VVEVTMLVPEKLQRVARVCEQLTETAEAVQTLYDAEPVHQPPTLRAVELRHVVRRLEEQRRLIEQLWS
jgi:Fe-S-cluster formation regulator IscX/YfhJ